MSSEVVIVGGGIAGLACAKRLTDAGRDVVVLEAGSQAGGNVGSIRADGFLLERGPHTFLPSADDVFALAHEAGVAPSLTVSHSSAHKRFIVRGGRLHKVFTGPLSFLGSRLLSFRGKWKLMGEPFRTKRRGDLDDTAAEFFTRRFGPEAARVLAGAFIAGVYAGDPESLSAPAAFPLFWRFEQEAGSMIRGALRQRRARREERRARGDTRPRPRGLCSFGEGLGHLPGTLATQLGERLRTDAPAKTISRDGDVFVVSTPDAEFRAGQLVVAVPPGEAGRLLAGLDAELADLLAAIPMAPLAVVHMGHARRAREVPDGFGFLAPRGEGVRTLGILFPARLFEGRAPADGDLFTAYIGGALDPDALDLDDGALVEIARRDLESLTGFAGAPDFVLVTRYPGAIPQFVHGHLARMERVESRRSRIPGLNLAGNYLRGVGMKDAVGSGFAAAAGILAAGGAP